MKIAIIGVRGIPVVYSGFETLAEKLAVGLTKRGHKITVFCRSSYISSELKEYKGIKLLSIPCFKNKNFETITHTLPSTIYACFKDYDLIFYTGVGNVSLSFFPRLFFKKTIVNVDGLDWKREKWNFIAKLYLSLSSRLAAFLPNAIITDSLFVQKYYKDKYKKDSSFLPYGYEKNAGKNSCLKEYKLQKEKYFVWAGRIVPDNHLEELITAFQKVKTDFRCVVIGDDVYESDYKNNIYSIAENDERIIFTGFLKKEVYSSVIRNSFCYVETKRSGGTHPSLVEAMGFGTLILSNSFIANKNILGDSALFYDENEKNLSEKLSNALKLKREELRDLKKRVLKKAKKNFEWEKIIGEYEKLFFKITQ